MDDNREKVVPINSRRLTEPVTIYWYEHDCDWISDFCDDHHSRTATVPRVVLEAIITR